MYFEGIEMLYEAKNDWESETAKIAGPFFQLQSKDVLMYYNLRYGAMSTQIPEDSSIQLILFA